MLELMFDKRGGHCVERACRVMIRFSPVSLLTGVFLSYGRSYLSASLFESKSHSIFSCFAHSTSRAKNFFACIAKNSRLFLESSLSLSFLNSNVLPQTCSTFVVDEAHKFFDAISGVFEIEITLRQVERFFKVYRTRMGKLRERFHEDAEEMEVLSKYLTKMEEHRREDVGKEEQRLHLRPKGRSFDAEDHDNE